MSAEKFEDKVRKINEIIEKLESGEITLDESIEFYGEAMKLITGCHNILDSAEGKIKKITMEREKIKLEDFE